MRKDISGLPTYVLKIQYQDIMESYRYAVPLTVLNYLF